MSTIEGQFGPVYNIESVSLQKFRRRAHNGLAALSKEERQAYGHAVETAVKAAQRSALMRVGTPLPRIYGKDEDIGKVIRAQHRAALAACPSQIRRKRTPAQWQAMYAAAMECRS